MLEAESELKSKLESKELKAMVMTKTEAEQDIIKPLENTKAKIGKASTEELKNVMELKENKVLVFGANKIEAENKFLATMERCCPALKGGTQVPKHVQNFVFENFSVLAR